MPEPDAAVHCVCIDPMAEYLAAVNNKVTVQPIQLYLITIIQKAVHFATNYVIFFGGGSFKLVFCILNFFFIIAILC